MSKTARHLIVFFVISFILIAAIVYYVIEL